MKPCPFCDEQPQIQTVDEGYHQVYCHKHTATIYLESFREWNTRPIEDRLEAEIERLKVLNRWIPVTERLPERRQFVLVTDCLNKYIAYTADTTDDVCFYSQKGGWLLDSITHWMELPEPPKEEE